MSDKQAAAAAAAASQGSERRAMPSDLPFSDYMSMVTLRALRCSFGVAPWIFGIAGVDQSLYSLIRDNAPSYKHALTQGVRVGLAQTLRATTWMCSASVFSAVAQEVLEVGPHFPIEPRAMQRNANLYTLTNVSGGALAGLLLAWRRDPTTAIGSRFNRILSRPQLRLAYTIIGGGVGLVLPQIFRQIKGIKSPR